MLTRSMLSPLHARRPLGPRAGFMLLLLVPLAAAAEASDLASHVEGRPAGEANERQGVAPLVRGPGAPSPIGPPDPPTRLEPVALGPLRLELPPGFSLLALSPRESGALAPAPVGAPRRLLGAAANGALDASLTVAIVDAPLEQDAAARDVIATRTSDHVTSELGLSWRVTAVSRGRAPDPAFEVVGRVEAQGEERGLAFLFVPTGRATAVLALSAPAEGLDALLPAARAVARSLHAASPPDADPATAFGPWLLATAVAAGLLVAIVRRSRRARAPAAPP